MLDASIQPRPTVAGLVVRPARPFPLIAIHWPKKAANEWQPNLTTAGGGILPGESLEAAMVRELGEEYGMVSTRVTALSHPRFEFHGKEYHWCLAVCESAAFSPLEDEVAAVGWYACPDSLKTAVQLMHEPKRQMFLTALGIACCLEPKLFGPYRRAVKLRKQAQRI